MRCSKLWVFLILFIFLGSSKLYSTEINVAVAANIYNVSKVIANNFTNKTGIKVNIISSSSGKLYQQIINGAPYHIFISADMVFPNKLVEKNYILGSPVVYAKGVLILWFSKEVSIQKFEDINKVYSTYSISLANPVTAPYGKAAVTALKNINLYNKIHSKLIIGDSINHVNHLIATKNVNMAFTAKSSVLSEEIKNLGQYVEVPTSYYDEILQGIVLLKYAQNNQNKEAEQFFKYFLSTGNKKLLKNYGYIIT